MLRKGLRHVRANAIAYVALFIALGTGGAYASSKIGASQIKSNAIRSKHIKDGEVKAPDIGFGALPHTWATRSDTIDVDLDTPGADCANPSPNCRYLSSTAAGGGGTMKTTSLPGSKVDIFVTGTLNVRSDDVNGGEVACLPTVRGGPGGGAGLLHGPRVDVWGAPPHEAPFFSKQAIPFDGHVRIAQGTYEVGLDCSVGSSGVKMHLTSGDLLAWAYPVR